MAMVGGLACRRQVFLRRYTHSAHPNTASNTPRWRDSPRVLKFARGQTKSRGGYLLLGSLGVAETLRRARN